MKRTLFIWFAFLALLPCNLGLIQTDRSENGHHRQKIELKIGIIAPFNGDSPSGSIETGVRLACNNLQSSRYFSLTYEKYPTDGNPYNVVTMAVNASRSVIGFIGETKNQNSELLAMVADDTRTPHICTTWTDSVLMEMALGSPQHPFMIRSCPVDSFQINAIADLIQFYGWDKVVIIGNIQKSRDATHLGQLLASRNVEVLMQNIYIPGDGSLQMFLGEIKERKAQIIILLLSTIDASNVIQIASIHPSFNGTNYVFLGSDELLYIPPSVLRKGYHVITTRALNYPLPWLDSPPGDLTDRQNGLIIPSTLIQATKSNESAVINQTILNGTLSNGTAVDLRSNYDIAYAYDAVYMFYYALEKLYAAGLDYIDSYRLMEELRASNFSGATGQVSFDPVTYDRITSYEVLKWSVNSSSFNNIGTWLRYDGLKMKDNAFPGGVPKSLSSEEEIPIGIILIHNKYNYQFYCAFVRALDLLVARDPKYFFGKRIKAIYMDAQNDEGNIIGPSLALAWEDVVGVLGAGSSWNSAAAHMILANYQIPLMSFSSTSSDLSNKELYPYFLRTIPSDATQGIAMARVCKHFGWDAVGALASSDIYGSAGSKIFLEEAAKLNITVTFQSVTGSDAPVAVSALKDAHCRVFILFASLPVYPKILHAAMDLGVIGPGFVWFASDSFMATPTQQYEEIFGIGYNDFIEGVIGTTPTQGEGHTYDTLVEAISKDWIDEYPDEGAYQPSWYLGYAFDAAFVLGMAIHNVMLDGKDPSDGRILLEYLKMTHINGTTGDISFDESGDRIGNYDILNWDSASNQMLKVGMWSHENDTTLFQSIQWNGNTSVPRAKPPECLLGEFATFEEPLMDFVCVPCQVGYYSPSIGADCIPCSPGSYANKNGSSTCMGCEPGEFQDDKGASTCKSCRPGTFAKNSNQVGCEQCEVGTFANSTGSAACVFCPAGFYVSVRGSTDCVECPQHMTTVFPGAFSKEDCVCLKGYYLSKSGCLACPEGGSCPGGSLRPVPAPGYWSSKEDPMNFLRCLNPNACSGGEAGTCAGNFVGRLCSDCADGYYPADNTCKRCEKSSTGPIQAAVWLAAIISMALILLANNNANTTYKNNMGVGTSLGILVQFLQILSIIALFRFDWPDPIGSAILFLRKHLVDLDFVMPTRCSVEIDYSTFYLLRVLIPIFFFAVILITYGAVKIHTYILKDLGLRNFMLRKYPSLLGPHPSGISPKSLRYFMCKPLTSVYKNLDFRGCINSMLMLLDLLYIYMISTGFEIFRCYSQPDGTDSLVVAPSITCYESQWYGLVPPSIISMVVWGLGTPLLFALLLYLHKKKRLGSESKANRTVSYLMSRWKEEKFYWQLIIMLRKFLVSFVISTFASTIDLQFLGGMAFLYASLALHRYHQPYGSFAHNRQEDWILQVLMMFLVTAVFLNIPMTYPTVRVVLAYVLLLALCVIIGVSVWSILYGVRAYQLNLLARKFEMEEVQTRSSDLGSPQLIRSPNSGSDSPLDSPR
eukprot:TRINITY_DN3657_c0_g1_i6.p1 TRINITY_DN3657_c0_g1~~TRINITY_DN3657_c0_g1_i6.p1  ORF type:complete len:1502 (-),score=352.50 TRINITY_DN3657_c0_g1_i6:67-4572(-)